MKRSFEKTEIKGLVLKNRYVRSATYEGLADEDGRASDRLAGMLAALAEGGVGLVVAGFSYIRQDGKTMPYQTGIHQADVVDGLKTLAAAIHKAGGRAAMQIMHGGILARPELTGEDVPAGPSAGEIPGMNGSSRELSIQEIQNLVEDFGRAADRVREAGFDAVQIHAAHGYLLSQFLSPVVNRRGDRYGGSPLNRARVVYETYEAVRGAVGADFPVLIKMNSEDFVDGGFDLESSVRVARNLADMGLDAVEVSGGLPWSKALKPARPGVSEPEQEAYFRRQGAAFKNRAGVPVILVGGFRSPQIVRSAMEQGWADYVALARPLIREPDLINRWAGGDLAPARCISCNRCFDVLSKGRGVYCVQKEKEDDRNVSRPPARP